jgi:hypothetical protein
MLDSILEEALGAALSRVEEELGHRAVLVKLPPDLPMVPADGLLLEQLFHNLLENAAKYTPEGTLVTVSGWAESGWVVVEVADSGPGLPPGTEERASERFVQLGDGVRGVGLGLTICRGIVMAHGGTILAENLSGGGVAFRFRIPIEGEARDRELDKVVARDSGADDYLSKPFGVGELVARLKVALRHKAAAAGALGGTVFTTSDLSVDLEARVVKVAGREVHLTRREFGLLAQLVQHAGKVLTHRSSCARSGDPSTATRATTSASIWPSSAASSRRTRLARAGSSPSPALATGCVSRSDTALQRLRDPDVGRGCLGHV